MISASQYSSFFLLFLQYGEGIGINFGCGLFGMFFPSTFLRLWCPQFSHSSVNDHPVPHMMTRMFSTVMILLGLIQYSLVRYCRTMSPTAENRSTKEYMLKIFVICMSTADMIHTFSFSNYQLRYGSLLDLSSFINIFGSITLFLGRIIFLWLNYQNKKKKT